MGVAVDQLADGAVLLRRGRGPGYSGDLRRAFQERSPGGLGLHGSTPFPSRLSRVDTVAISKRFGPDHERPGKKPWRLVPAASIVKPGSSASTTIGRPACSERPVMRCPRVNSAP